MTTRTETLAESADRIGQVLTALHDLGVFKPGEEQRTLHAHGCRWREGDCTCPGGPELVFSDWNETRPMRELVATPERFHAR